jgi:nucleotidyltransferase/DNA polymerase involved in DNA repair
MHIFHVDKDSFFASVEVREHPELKSLPVIAGP